MSEQIAPRKTHEIVLDHIPANPFFITHPNSCAPCLNPGLLHYRFLSCHTSGLTYPEYAIGHGSSCYFRLFPGITLLQGPSIALEIKYKLQSLSFKVSCMTLSTSLLQFIQKLYTVSPPPPHYPHLQPSLSCFQLLPGLHAISLLSCFRIHNNFAINMPFRTHFSSIILDFPQLMVHVF